MIYFIFLYYTTHLETIFLIFAETNTYYLKKKLLEKFLILLITYLILYFCFIYLASNNYIYVHIFVLLFMHAIERK